MTVAEPIWAGGEPALLLSAHGISTQRWATGESVVLHGSLLVETIVATSYMTRGLTADSKMTKELAGMSNMTRELEAEVTL